MTRSRSWRLVALAGVFTIAACSSSSSGSGADDTSASTSTSSTSSTTSTSVVDESTTTTAAAATTVAATSPTPAPTTAAPPPTAPPATSPPATGPKVTSISVTGPSCASPDVSYEVPSQPVKVSWVATGADSVYVAIDNPDGPFMTGLPLSGSVDLPDPCPGPYSHTYYVVAVKGAQKAVKSKTLTG